MKEILRKIKEYEIKGHEKCRFYKDDITEKQIDELKKMGYIISETKAVIWCDYSNYTKDVYDVILRKKISIIDMIKNFLGGYNGK